MARDLLPPADLILPIYVREGLGDRADRVVGQGFDESELRLEWWNDELKQAGLGSFLVSTDPNGSGAQRLTRGEIFQLAAGPTLAADEAILNLLWHVLAWGSGTSRRNNRARIKAFADPGSAAANLALLRTAATHARAGVVAVAYSCLIRRGGGMIPGLGPAFFTKFLYFVGAGNPSHTCLILDARVASSLHDSGWVGIPRRRTGAGWSYSANWYTTTTSRIARF